MTGGRAITSTPPHRCADGGAPCVTTWTRLDFGDQVTVAGTAQD